MKNSISQSIFHSINIWYHKSQCRPISTFLWKMWTICLASFLRMERKKNDSLAIGLTFWHFDSFYFSAYHCKNIAIGCRRPIYLSGGLPIGQVYHGANSSSVERCNLICSSWIPLISLLNHSYPIHLKCQIYYLLFIVSFNSFLQTLFDSLSFDNVFLFVHLLLRLCVCLIDRVKIKLYSFCFF